MRAILLIANPRAGKGDAIKHLRNIAAEFEKRGIRTRSIVANSAEDSASALRREIESGLTAVIAFGGDGLVHLVIQTLAESEVALFVVACGTGNDFARTGGNFDFDPVTVVDRVLTTEPRAIDLGRVVSQTGTRWFGQVLSTGFDSLVNERANSFRLIRGKITYTVAILLELPFFAPLEYEIETSVGSRKFSAMLVAIANGPSYGGGMKICPGANRSDGYLEVMILHPVGKMELLRVFPKVFKGEHVNHPAVEFLSVKSISLQSKALAYADGERIGSLPIKIDLVRNAIRVWETR